MEKIEYIEVNGNEVPLSIFPTDIKNLVSTFEIVRGEYNKSVVNTQALNEYMQRLSQQIQQMADGHVQSLTAPKQPALETSEATSEEAAQAE